MSELEIESPDDPRLIGTYRPFSGLAVLAFVLSVAATIGIVNPQLFLLPLIALIVSLVACFRIGSAKNPPVGAGLALLAAFLSGLFLCSGLLYARLRQAHYFEVAQQYANIWFDLVQDGEVYRPHHLMREFPRRQPSTIDIAKYYQELTDVPNESQDSRIEIREYEQLEPEKSIRQYGHEMTCQFDGPHYYQYRVKTEYFTLKYTLRWPAESGRPDWPLLIMLQRKEHKLPWGTQWTVIDVYPTGEPKMFERARRGVGLAD